MLDYCLALPLTHQVTKLALSQFCGQQLNLSLSISYPSPTRSSNLTLTQCKKVKKIEKHVHIFAGANLLWSC